MTRAAPIGAMLWEHWRLSRVEAAWRLAVGIVAGSAALMLFDAGALNAFWILMLCHAFFWFSIAKLNGGRFTDGYKPGFPLYLLYARPVSTAELVGVAMVYDAVSCTALYVASAALLGFAFGQPLPLFSVVVYLVAYHLACTCIQWSTRSRVIQWTASFVVGFPLFFLLKNRVGAPLHVEFTLVENALLIVLGVVSIVITVAGVARQRRGDSIAIEPRPAGSGVFPGWLINVFRVPCPTSSATRAQVWFELRSSGLPVLAIGLFVALMICLLFAIGISVVPVRFAAAGVTFLSGLVVLFTLGSNAFGIRRKQGRTYASAFEMTLPCGTAQLAGLKVLVRTVCVLVALIAIGASVWASSSFMGEWGTWLPDGKNDSLPGLLKLRQAIADNFGELKGYANVAQAVVASIAVAGVIAWQAAREALRARFPRQLLVVQWLPVAVSLAMLLLTAVLSKGFEPVPLLGTIFAAMFWISGAVLATAAIYFLWSGLAQRVITYRYACGALAISAAFALAWRAGLTAGDIFGISWLALGILMIGAVTPWALSRVRHT